MSIRQALNSRRIKHAGRLEIFMYRGTQERQRGRLKPYEIKQLNRLSMEGEQK